MAQTRKSHFVYMYKLNGEVCYIGKSDSSLRSRITAHEKEKKFAPYAKAEIYCAPLKNSTETTVYEKMLIDKYSPVLNVVDKHRETIDIQFEEPKWMPYEALCRHTADLRSKKRECYRIIREATEWIQANQEIIKESERELRIIKALRRPACVPPKCKSYKRVALTHPVNQYQPMLTVYKIKYEESIRTRQISDYESWVEGQEQEIRRINNELQKLC